MALITVEEEDEAEAEAGYDIWREMSGVSLMAFSFGLLCEERKNCKKVSEKVPSAVECTFRIWYVSRTR